MRHQALTALTLGLVILAARPSAGQTPSPEDPSRVLILYDRNEGDGNGNGIGDSEEIAGIYAAVRGVPNSNLLGLNISTSGHYYSGSTAWTQVWDDVIAPLQAKLNALGTSAIDTILLSYGVPYRFVIPGATSFSTRAIDNFVGVPFSIGTRSQHALPYFKWSNPYFEPSPSRAPDLGRFNHAQFSFLGKPLYLVSRLDGPSVHAARELMEGARYGDRYIHAQPGHYGGYGYVDTRYGKYTSAVLDGYPFGYGSYQNADLSIAFGQRFIATSGLQLKWEPTGKEIGESGAVYHDNTPALTAPNALLYTGWYNYGAYHDVWNWLPGSIACDLNSNSIQNFHQPYNRAFLTMAFTRGLSAGAGVIAEPYLSGHYRPEVLLHYVLQGYTWAEAAALSNPALGWVCVQLGDPLYAPFRVGKKPIRDTTPPPPPRIHVDVESGGTAQVVAALDTLKREPDLVTARIDYGTSPAFTHQVDHDKIYRVRKTVALGSLVTSTLYYYRIQIRDPAGLERSSGPYVFFSAPAAPIRTHIDPPRIDTKPNAWFTLTFIFVCEPDLRYLDGLKLELIDDNNQTTHDVTLLAYLAVTDLFVSPDLDTLAAKVRLPAALPAGQYRFRSTIHKGTSVQIAECTVVIQSGRLRP